MSMRGLGASLRTAYPDLRGTSDSAVRHYHEGNVLNPRIELLRAMADVLGVRSDWLAWNEGPMTEEEARAAELRATAVPKPTLGEALADHVPGFDELPPVVQAGVVHTALRWASADHPRFRDPVDTPLDVSALKAGEEILATMFGPIEAWELSLDEIDMNRYEDYCLAMLNALALSTPRENEVPWLASSWTTGKPGRRLSDPREVSKINESVQAVRREASEDE